MNRAADSAPERIDAATLRIAGTVVLGAIMTTLDTTVVNVALDTLAVDFDASIASVQWVATVGVAVLAVVLEHQLPGAVGGVTGRSGSTADALATTFRWVFVLAAVAFIPAAFLPRTPPPAVQEVPLAA